MRQVANERPLLLPLGRPSNLLRPVHPVHLAWLAIPNFVHFASDLYSLYPRPKPPKPQDPGPRPHALVALAANWVGGKDDIVMIPARWRCEISEALAPGHLPGHSQSTSPPTASAGLCLLSAVAVPHRARRAYSQEGGHRRLVSPRYLPAAAQPFRIRSPLSKHIK